MRALARVGGVRPPSLTLGPLARVLLMTELLNAGVWPPGEIAIAPPHSYPQRQASGDALCPVLPSGRVKGTDVRVLSRARQGAVRTAAPLRGARRDALHHRPPGLR